MCLLFENGSEEEEAAEEQEVDSVEAADAGGARTVETREGQEILSEIVEGNKGEGNGGRELGKLPGDDPRA